jgi:hypothetical protein
MARQTTLLTAHKGVDLHAATAVRVMQQRLDGGDKLVALCRCECHTFWDDADGYAIGALLEIGRYFNPNKHHYGHFELDGAEDWRDTTAHQDHELPEPWPGAASGSDLPDASVSLYDRLLGGRIPDGCRAVDVCAFPLGTRPQLLSGILWRLILRVRNGQTEQQTTELAQKLVVTRSGKSGLLVNPHMEGWLVAVR